MLNIEKSRQVRCYKRNITSSTLKGNEEIEIVRKEARDEMDKLKQKNSVFRKETRD